MAGNVKIVSDGTPVGTMVTVGGVEMTGVTLIDIKITMDGVTGLLEICNPEVIVDGLMESREMALVSDIGAAIG